MDPSQMMIDEVHDQEGPKLPGCFFKSSPSKLYILILPATYFIQALKLSVSKEQIRGASF